LAPYLVQYQFIERYFRSSRFRLISRPVELGRLLLYH